MFSAFCPYFLKKSKLRARLMKKSLKNSRDNANSESQTKIAAHCQSWKRKQCAEVKQAKEAKATSHAELWWSAHRPSRTSLLHLAGRGCRGTSLTVGLINPSRCIDQNWKSNFLFNQFKSSKYFKLLVTWYLLRNQVEYQLWIIY